MLDSLVRVTRRVAENHFAKIANAASRHTSLVPNQLTTQNFVLRHKQPSRDQGLSPKGADYRSSIHPSVGPGGYNRNQLPNFLPSTKLSAPKRIDFGTPEATGPTHPHGDDRYRFRALHPTAPHKRIVNIAPEYDWLPALPS